MKKFDYRVLKLDHDDPYSQMLELQSEGSDGWELVSAVRHQDESGDWYTFFYFKKPMG